MWEYYVNFILHAINISIFIWKYKRYSKPLKVIGFNIIVICLIDCYAAHLALQGTRNLYLFHAITAIQFISLAFFYQMIITNQQMKTFATILIPVFLVCVVVNAMYFNTLHHYPSYTIIIKHFFVTIFVLTYFFELFYAPKDILLQYEPYFWISFGLLLSSMGNFFIEGLLNHLMERSNALALRFYLAGALLNYIYYTTITIAFIVAASDHRTYPSFKILKNET